MRGAYIGFGTKLTGRSILVLYALILAIPLVWMVISSFKTSAEVYGTPFGLPEKWLFSNYVDAWDQGISRYFTNSLIVTFLTTAGVLVFAAFAAYSMVRVDGLLSRLMLVMVIAALVVSPELAVVPLYDLLGKVGLLDTYWAMILPYIAYRIPMAVLLIRAVFLGIPRDLEEASRIDGCGSFRTFRNVYWPLSSGVLVTAGILTIYYTWNEFLFALIFMNTDNFRTIPAGLMAFRDALQTNWSVLLAGLVLAALPIVILFIFAQRFFIEGVTSGSVKG